MPPADEPFLRRRWPWLLAAGLWLAGVVASLAARPLLPMDETRYLAVAWEMQQRGDWLVPHLNGVPYHHKPPLLFWLIGGGWSVLGVCEWWARLVPMLAAAAAAVLAAWCARLLWPERPQVARFAPLALVGTGFWAAITTVVLFDGLLTACVLLAFAGVLLMRRGSLRCGTAVAACGLGLGLLAKGPAVLVHVLPAALLAPLWLVGGRPAWWRWYAGVGMATAAACLIGLAWALPAARAGGDEYTVNLLWGQTVHRLVDAFAHKEPWWFYLAWLPVLLLPWVCWPPLWRAARIAWRDHDEGVRLLAIWAAAAFAVFSLISGKNPQYLLPELAALALLVARLLPAGDLDRRGWDRWPWAAVLALAGLVGLAWALFPPARLPVWLGQVTPLLGIMVLALAVAVAGWRPSAAPAVLAVLSASAVLALATFIAMVAPAVVPAYDLRPMAARIMAWRAAGRPVAHLGNYQGEYHFYARLTEPLLELDPPALWSWARAHPDGVVVAPFRGRPEVPLGEALVSMPFRGRSTVGAWEARTVQAALPGSLAELQRRMMVAARARNP